MSDRENPNPHLAKFDAEPKPLFHSGFMRHGRPERIILPPLPHLPTPFDPADIDAWKAMNAGTAATHQQRRAMEHLALLSGWPIDPFVAGDPIATAYALGKRRVFQQITDFIRSVEAAPRTAHATEQG